MSIIKFGNTWWGQKWLLALEDIDYENRLPRGKLYAIKGAVLQIKIESNIIYSKVKGTRPGPYKVCIKVPKFTDKQEKTILNTITENPFYLSKLLTGQLPPELYDDLSKLGINIFPSRWGDLFGECSCPDWAVPCKHIAAVLYIIANEIDKNPFIVFQLHGLDIIKKLEEMGYKKENLTYIKSIKDIIYSELDTPNRNIQNNIECILNEINLSIIPHLRDYILSILPNKPLFYLKANFKEIFKQVYKRVEKCITRFIAYTNGVNNNKEWNVGNYNEIFNQSNFISSTYEYTKLKMIFNEELKLTEAILESNKQTILFKDTKQYELIKLINYINNIKSSNVLDHSPKIIALYIIYNFCIRLLQQGAFIPEFIQIDESRYIIRWIPALINETVKDIFNNIKLITPNDLLSIKIDKDSTRKTNKKRRTNKIVYPSVDEQVLIVCSMFLSHFISLFIYQHFFCSLYEESLLMEHLQNDILKVFFDKKVMVISKFEELQIPYTIYLWISRFYIIHKNFVPLIMIEPVNSHFTIDVLVENKKDPLQVPIRLSYIFNDKKYEDIRAEILKDLVLLSEQFPDLSKIISSKGMYKLVFNSIEFVDVFFNILPTVKLLGINILLPKELQDIVNPRLTLAMKKNKNFDAKSVSYFNINELISFDWRIAIGDQFLSPNEFMELVKGMNGIIKIKDNFVLIKEEDINKILNNINKRHKLSSWEIIKVGLEGIYNGAKVYISEEVMEILNALIKVEEVPLPRELKAVMREYQKRGYEWMYKNSKIGFGSILADDMGLGKTLQVIAILLKLKEENKINSSNPALVVVPTTLLTNWYKEIQKFAPSLNVFIYHGQKRHLNIGNDIDIVITSYGILRNEIEKFKDKKWMVVVIDEAQNIKNPNTEQTKAVKMLNSEIRIAMSGTPVENRLKDYWSIFDFVNKGYLGGLLQFEEEYAIPIEMYRDKYKLEKFKRITAPFILRRVKTDKNIIKDLPDKMEFEQYCNLTKEQSALYQNVLNNIMKSIEESEGIERRGLVLKLITSLKQICNHPSQFLKNNESNPKFSGKAMFLLDLLEDIYENNQKVLIFTQYKEMGDLLIDIIEKKFNEEVLFLSGQNTRKERDKMVEAFQNEKYLRTMILTLKAGGTGLNLTEASNVIHYDLWWNPAIEQQATDRAYRIGQSKKVTVYRLISQGTFEEKINNMLKSKKELADLTVSVGEKWIGELSNEEIREIFKLETL